MDSDSCDSDCCGKRVPTRERVFFFLLLILFALSSTTLAQTAPPNVIVILADDLGYGDVSFNGCPDYATPNIDSIASNGALCTNGYATHPFCSPSRAALLTGRYQQRFGHENQPTSDAANPRLGIPSQELLLPQILKPAGYVCGAIGKWHLGVAPSVHPMQRGFDEFFGFLENQSTYYNAAILRGTTTIREPAYLTDAFTREAVSFINRHAAEPFFLFLSYNAVHAPYDTPPAIYMDRVANITDANRRVYAAMTIALDDGVGQVLQTLAGQNLLDKTLLFFLSDNGAGGVYGRNYPLRGYKWDVLEGGIHVPFAVQWRGRLPGHSVYADPVSSLDIVPTAAAAAGVQLPTNRVYDGLNIIPYLAGEQISPQRTLFWRWFGLGKDGPPADPLGANGLAGGSPGTIWAVRSGPLKLVVPRATVTRPPALYNLQTDIGESQDLAGTQPADVNALTTQYNQWNSDTIPPLWLNFEFNYGNILPLVLAGDWNGYNNADSALPWQLTRVTAPGVEGTPDGFNWFTTTIYVANIGGDTTPGLHSFTLVGASSYATQWGGVTINVDGTTSVPFFSGSVLGPTNSISLDDGYYYSFRILEWTKQAGASMKLAVMKTSAPPVSVRLNGQAPAMPTSNDAVTVNITTNQPKSVEERIYLRWSTDLFITSHMVEAAGSGVNYSAIIPAQPAGTGVQYCATTSTIDLSSLVTSGTIDSQTLATSSNSHFVVSNPAGTTPTPTPTVTPTPTPSPSPSGTPTPTATATPTASPTPTPTATPTPSPSPTVQMTVQTSFMGLTFSVDGTTYSSTQTFSWASGSTHTITTTSPQSGGTGVQYVWVNWSDGKTISHTVAPTTNKTYTAKFATQYYLTMSHGTGGTVSTSSGWKSSGAAVSISATPTNNSSVSYNFSGWAGSGTGSYSGTNNPASITMNGPITENATFIQNPVQISVQTNPAGRSFSVDGTTYTAAQSFSWDPGSSHTISTSSPQSGGTGVQNVWKNWSDSGAISHTVSATTNKTYTANFTIQYYLTMTKGSGGTVTPSSGWRNSGAAVSIKATPATGYTFTGWTGTGTGSYTGVTNPNSITMGGPITETASFTH